MTYVLCADVHAHPWSQFSRPNADGINSRLADVLAELHRMGEEAERRGAERIYIAGDLFHERGQIRPSVFNPVWHALTRIAVERGVTWRILPGNHDLEGREASWIGNATSALQQTSDRPLIEIANAAVFHEDDRVAMIPWIPEREGVKAALDSLRKTLGRAGEDPQDYDVLMHTGISDVIANVPGHFNATELAGWGFKRVFSGHYHNRKSFCDGTVWSIGAPAHQTWSDVGTAAGFLFVDGDVVTEFDTQAPRFIDFDPDDIAGVRDNFVRVRDVDLDDAEIKELREALEAAGARGVVIHAAPKIPSATRSSAAQKAATLADSVRAFVSEAGHDEGVRDAALEILKEAEEAL